MHHALWSSAVCILTYLLSKDPYAFLKKTIVLHNMRYFGHRASLSKVKYVWTCEHYQRMLVSSYNNAMHGNTIFIWRISIPGKLDDFCLAYVLFPLISPAFIYNVIIRLIKYLTCQGDVAQNKTTNCSRTTMPCQKGAECIQYTDILYTIFVLCSNSVSLA